LKTHISHTLLKAVRLLSDAPQRGLSKVAARLGSFGSVPAPPPDHVMMRLESVFEALSELSLQPNVAAAFDLACEALQAELPTEAVAAGLYDIDADEVGFVAAHGVGHERLRGTALPRGRCLVGGAVEEAIVVRGDAPSAGWLGAGGADATVLLCPIRHDGHLLGVLALADPLCAAEFSHHDLELVAYVADQLAVFIQAQRLRPSTAAPARAG
jgi:GAF domain-containing protein